MELNKVEALLDKYFEGETSIKEQKELQDYFSSQDIAPQLLEYAAIFKSFSVAKTEHFTQDVMEPKAFNIQKKYKKVKFYWISVAASVVVLLGIGTYLFYASDPLITDKDLGTYDDPKLAFEATQKALLLLSNNVNTGIESVHYIEEYQIAKNRIFRNTENKSEEL